MLVRRFVPLGIALLAMAFPAQGQQETTSENYVILGNRDFDGNQTANVDFQVAIVPDLSAATSVLGLTDAQRRGVEALIEARRTRDADLARALFEARRSLDAVLASDNPTALAVGQAYLDVQAGEESLAGSAARFRTEVESMLTGEQQIRVGELRQAAEDIAAIGSLGLVPGHTGTRSGATWFAAAPAIEGDGAFHLERRIEVHRNVPAQN